MTGVFYIVVPIFFKFLNIFLFGFKFRVFSSFIGFLEQIMLKFSLRILILGSFFLLSCNILVFLRNFVVSADFVGIVFVELKAFQELGIFIRRGK